ncbi:MAG: YhbY family RNA-binding protein [Ruminococcus sp.]|jgi:RNA-binding protein|nr:YhbY family RNA-binding protein [Ruminococcus sp.]
MMDSKFRAKLRADAAPLDVILTIGKNGVTDATITEALNAFSSRELIKARVLETAPGDIRDCAGEVATAVDAEIVHIIGNTFVLYKKLPEKVHVKPKPRKLVSNVKVRRGDDRRSVVRVYSRGDNAEARKGYRQNSRKEGRKR